MSRLVRSEHTRKHTPALVVALQQPVGRTFDTGVLLYSVGHFRRAVQRLYRFNASLIGLISSRLTSP